VLNMFRLSILSVLLLASTAIAQPVAKITGPTQVPAGELTAISSTGSVGDNLIWIKPDGLSAIQAGCEMMDQQLFFSTTREGVYEFILIVADKSAGISYAKHSVSIGRPITPGPPVEPPPPAPGKWADMIGISRAGADRVNDPTTRAALKISINSALDAIKKQCEASKCPGLPQAQAEVTKAIDNALLVRSDRFSGWDTWRRSNNAHMKEKTVTNMPDYLDAVRAIVAGL